VVWYNQELITRVMGFWYNIGGRIEGLRCPPPPLTIFSANAMNTIGSYTLY